MGVSVPASPRNLRPSPASVLGAPCILPQVSGVSLASANCVGSAASSCSRWGAWETTLVLLSSIVRAAPARCGIFPSRGQSLLSWCTPSPGLGGLTLGQWVQWLQPLPLSWPPCTPCPVPEPEQIMESHTRKMVLIKTIETRNGEVSLHLSVQGSPGQERRMGSCQGAMCQAEGIGVLGDEVRAEVPWGFSCHSNPSITGTCKEK